MLQLTFIVPLMVNFFYGIPGFIDDGPTYLYNKLMYYNDTSIVVHQKIDNENAVVFVHGRNGHSNHFDKMIKGLIKLGVNRTLIAINLGPTGLTSVNEDTKTLDNILKKIGTKKIILVGLSKGGLTVSNYVATYGTANVTAIITISSPLDGTMVTDNLLPEKHIARIELGYKSNFTQELKNRLPTNIPFYHVVPTWDHVIIPCNSASIEGPNHESKVHNDKYYSHLNIQNAPDVIDWIRDWINKN